MSSPVLSVQDATLVYPRRQEPAVAGATIEITAGSSLGIVGESGSGKTTLGRMLVGVLLPTGGTVSIGGRSWADVDARDPLRSAVQMVFQDAIGSLNPMLTPLQTVAEVCRVKGGMSKSEATTRATELLSEVGLAGAVIQRRPRGLSGGQCQRVGIARALACDPSVLIADEPTSSLDVSVQAQILNLLLDLRERHKLALVLISHDLSVVAYMTSHAAVMYRGYIVERGPTDALLDRPLHPYTKGLVDSIPERRATPEFVQNPVDAGSGCVFAPRCPRYVAECSADQPALRPVADHSVACLRPLVGDDAGRRASAAGPPSVREISG